MTRSGLSVLEAVVVVCVIMILLGMLFPAISHRRPTQKPRSRVMIAQLSAACEHYRLLNGAYPDSQGMRAVFMSGPKPRRTEEITEDGWSTVASELIRLLATVDRDPFAVPGFTLKDPWKKRVYRYCLAAYVALPEHVATAVDSPVAPRWDSFQVWSAGADGIDQPEEAAADDICSWR